MGQVSLIVGILFGYIRITPSCGVGELQYQCIAQSFTMMSLLCGGGDVRAAVDTVAGSGLRQMYRVDYKPGVDDDRLDREAVRALRGHVVSDTSDAADCALMGDVVGVRSAMARAEAYSVLVAMLLNPEAV